MQAYQLVVPEGVAPGDVLWVTVDPKTRTATGVPADEVKADHTLKINHLKGIVRPTSLCETIGPHKELWPDIVRRISAERYGAATVRFIDFARCPEAFVTTGGVYRKGALPENLVASSRIHYAAFFAPQGHAAALSAFHAATEGWTRIGCVTAMQRLFYLSWIEADKCPDIKLDRENQFWMKWSESSILLPSGEGFCDVRSFCAPQASPMFRISMRKNQKGYPTYVIITEDKSSLDAVTVYPDVDIKGQLPLTYERK